MAAMKRERPGRATRTSVDPVEGSQCSEIEGQSVTLGVPDVFTSTP